MRLIISGRMDWRNTLDHKNDFDQDLLLTLHGEANLAKRIKVRWQLLTSKPLRERARQFGMVTSGFSEAISGRAMTLGLSLGIKLLFLMAFLSVLGSSVWYISQVSAETKMPPVVTSGGDKDCSSEPGSVEEFKKSRKGKGIGKVRL